MKREDLVSRACTSDSAMHRDHLLKLLTRLYSIKATDTVMYVLCDCTETFLDAFSKISSLVGKRKTERKEIFIDSSENHHIDKHTLFAEI